MENEKPYTLRAHGSHRSDIGFEFKVRELFNGGLDPKRQEGTFLMTAIECWGKQSRFDIWNRFVDEYRLHPDLKIDYNKWNAMAAIQTYDDDPAPNPWIPVAGVQRGMIEDINGIY